VGDLERLLAHVPFALERATFVDLGAGMGRALFAAGRFPFRQIAGVEISPALVAVARDNLAAFPRDGLVCRDLRIVRGDATAFRFPRGDLVVYLYNPFDATVLARVLENLERSPRANLALIYHTPVERAAIDERARFELLAEEPCGVVYRCTTTR
jgi:SAM-dependent methyltransferase